MALPRTRSESIEDTKSEPPLLRVLLVDDAEVVRRHVREALAPIAGVHIIGEAETADRGIDLMAAHAPDVVILDIRLLVGHGIDVLLAKEDLEPEPVVVVMTNYPLPPYRKICLDLGADHFLDKTKEFDRLGEILRDLAAARRLTPARPNFAPFNPRTGTDHP